MVARMSETVPDMATPASGPMATIPVALSTLEGRSSGGAMTVRDLTTGERLGRALRAMAVCWVLAVCSILVPLLHWVLVPGLLLGSFGIAYAVFQRVRIVAGGGGPCPMCSSPVALRIGANPRGFGQAC